MYTHSIICDSSSPSPQAGPDSPSETETTSYTTEKYVEEEDKYQQIAVGEGSDDAEETVENKIEEMKEEIRERDGALEG